MFKFNFSQGFQLIELLITLSIVGLLIAISLPTYDHYLVRAKRLEATTVLSKLAIALEEYELAHHTYQGATLAVLQFPEYIAKNNYQLQILTTTNTYLLTAKPINQQAEKDLTCGGLTLSNTGEKNITGVGNVAECW